MTNEPSAHERSVKHATVKSTVKYHRVMEGVQARQEDQGNAAYHPKHNGDNVEIASSVALNIGWESIEMSKYTLQKERKDVECCGNTCDRDKESFVCGADVGSEGWFSADGSRQTCQLLT
jgi:hypothetical protein